ncbi:MAG: alanine:cation symporter family protein [Clostridium fessum]
MNTIINLIEKTYYFLWGDWIHLPLPGGTTINLPLLVLLLVPTGIFCTIRTCTPGRSDASLILRALLEKAETGHKGGSLSALQALIVSTATRVGMGNLVGIVAALSAGGAGALFWMRVTAASAQSLATAFIEATLQPRALSQTAGSALLAVTAAVPSLPHFFNDWINSKRQKQGTPVSKKNLLSVPVCALRSDLARCVHQPGHQ